MFIGNIEFARKKGSKDKTKRKRRKRGLISQGAAKGAKIGALLGTGTAAAALYRERKNLKAHTNQLHKQFRALGMDKRTATRKAVTSTLGGAALGTGISAGNSAVDGAIVGAGVGGVLAARKRLQAKRKKDKEKTRRG